MGTVEVRTSIMADNKRRPTLIAQSHIDEAVKQAELLESQGKFAEASEVTAAAFVEAQRKYSEAFAEYKEEDPPGEEASPLEQMAPLENSLSMPAVTRESSSICEDVTEGPQVELQVEVEKPSIMPAMVKKFNANPKEAINCITQSGGHTAQELAQWFLSTEGMDGF